MFAKERLPQQPEVYSEMFGRVEIDRRVKLAMNEQDTKWTKKNRVGLRAKMAKEVWMEADEMEKNAVNAKIAELAEKRKGGSGARAPEQYLEFVFISRILALCTYPH
jgi:hypothetical protein